MKYLIILSLITVFGCGMFGDKSEPKRKNDPIRPPAPHEIIKNPDGTYTVIIDESLNVKPDKEGVSITKWLCSLTFLVVTCLGAWRLIKYVYTKELKKGYDK
jgi:hypothetical protein